MAKETKASGKHPIQDFYPKNVAICYGCGPHNPQGLQIKTYWDGTEGICRFRPLPHHTAFPGFVYGGLIASLIDCHSVGTAIAAAYATEGRKPGSKPAITFVTGTLSIRYIRPTPMDIELELRAQVKSQKEKKSVVACSLYADGQECARGEIIAVRAPWEINPGFAT